MNNKLFFSIFAVILLIGIVSASPSQVAGSYLTSIMQSYYQMNETGGANIIDYMNNLNGTANVTGGFPKQGVSIPFTKFTGYDYSLIVGSQSYFTSQPLPSAGSYAFWVQFNQTVPNQQIIFQNAGLNCQLFNSAGAHIYCSLNGGSNFVNDATSLATNVPYLVVITWNGAGTWNLYVNSTSPTSTAAAGSGNSNTIYIGSSNGANYLNGYIGPIAIFNQSVNSTVVQDLLNIGPVGWGSASSSSVTITLNSPQNATSIGIASNPVTFNATITNSSISIANVSLLIDGVVNETNTSGLSGNYLFNKNMTVGTHIWSVRATSTTGATYNSTNNTLLMSQFTLLNNSYNLSTYETKSETFNFTINTSFAPSNAILNYNGTSYNANITNLGGGNYSISATIDVPLIVGNSSFYYFWTTSMGNVQSLTYIQQVQALSFSACGTSNPYINFTFQDESTQLPLSASINSLTFNYWLGSGSQALQYLYSNTSSQLNYTFCLTPSNLTLNTNWTINYQASSYLARTYINTSSILTNSTYNQVLNLLATSSGQIVTFQVVNPAQQPLIGVFGVATRTINGVNTVVGSGYSGSDGGISFFVNPLLTYTFTFSKVGYTTFSFTTNPSQTSYTITLGENTQSNNDYTRGITYSIIPSSGILNNNTIYSFNYTINSSFWTLSSFSYSIYGDNVLLVSNSSNTGTGGMISSFVNVSNYTQIYMNYSYVINGTNINGTISWYVSNIQNDQYSISHLFGDIQTYASLGIFGSTNWAIGLITFLIIFITVGTMSYRYGFNTRANLIAVLCGLVVLFDVGLNFDVYMNPLVGAVPYLPSVLMVVMAISTIVREETR